MKLTPQRLPGGSPTSAPKPAPKPAARPSISSRIIAAAKKKAAPSLGDYPVKRAPMKPVGKASY